MKIHLILEDSPNGVLLQAATVANGCSDNAQMSLAAMWLTKWYTEMQTAHGKGHAYIQEKDNLEEIRLH